MGQRSKIAQLPPEVRRWLDTVLSEKNYSGYAQLEDELKRRGYSIGKSSIHRYGTKLERRLAAIKASVEGARLFADVAPDDAAQLPAAVMAMIQTDMFNVLVSMQDLEDADPMQRAKLLSTVAKNVATLSRASVTQKKHELEIRGKTQAAADKVARLAKKGGLSGATVENIKREILGIAA